MMQEVVLVITGVSAIILAKLFHVYILCKRGQEADKTAREETLENEITQHRLQEHHGLDLAEMAKKQKHE